MAAAYAASSPSKSSSKSRSYCASYYAKQDPEKAKTFVLRDHFDFLAGTSTGAIIATCLCWGMPAQEVKDLYIAEGRKMFESVSWRHPIRKLFSLYDPGPLTDFLQRSSRKGTAK